MRPTVGRIVHFYSTDPRYQSNGQGEGPYAAIVTGTDLGNADAPNLCVFQDGGDSFPVFVVPEGPAEGRSTWWRWPGPLTD